MQYTQCKIVGNGSFRVVFQTKLSRSGEDATIKRVLQDKRCNGSFGIVFQTRLSLSAIERVLQEKHSKVRPNGFEERGITHLLTPPRCNQRLFHP